MAFSISREEGGATVTATKTPKIVEIAKKYINVAHAEFRTPEVAGGKLACAKVVSWILKEAGEIEQTEIQVDKLVTELEVLGWQRSNQPQIGDVVVWDKTPSFSNKHIGIVTGQDLAVNNSSYVFMPIETPIYSENRPVLFFLTKAPKLEIAQKSESKKFPVFAKWKGERAQNVLRLMWEISGGNIAFVLTMAAENGTFDPTRKHPDKNSNGTQDYSFGLNDAYHLPFIQKILAGTVTDEEIVRYHWDIYSGPKNTTSCGYVPFCGYNRRNEPQIKKLILFP